MRFQLSSILSRLLCLMMTCFVFGAAYAAEEQNKGISAENYDNMQKSAAAAGFTFTQNGGNLDIILDEAKVLAQVPSLVQADVIAKVDASDIKNMPLSVSVYAVGVTFAVTIMTGVYAKYTNVDKLRVTTYVLPTGGKEKQPCFSFDFTRALYDKLDLNTTNTNDFMKDAPNFSFSPFCETELSKEEKAINSSNSN